MSKHDIYGGKDPRDIPTYTVREAAHHLRLPQATLRLWLAGGPYSTQGGTRRSQPLIAAASKRPWILSFWNLVEAQVLATIRRKHTVSMQRVRRALTTVERSLEQKRPLITSDFATDGVDLFVDAYGKLLRVSDGRLEELAQDLHASLERIERDDDGLAEKFYPWAKAPSEDRVVKVDPYVAFGKPVVKGTAVPTAVLAERWEAGDSFTTLAREYDITNDLVEDAVRWQLGHGQAAA